MPPEYPLVCKARVTEVLDPIGAIVKCEIPDLAPGYHWGPIESMVDGLAVDDWVMTAQVGFKRDDRIILGRQSGRRSTTGEIVGLDDALDLLVTRLEYADHQDRIDQVSALLDDRIVVADDDLAGLQRARADISALRRRIGDLAADIAANASNVSAAQAAITATRLALYGSTDAAASGAVPQIESRLSADATNLQANTNYLATSLWTSFRDTEAAAGRAAMLTLGTTIALPTRVTIPFTGDWTVELSARTTATSGYGALKILLNADLSKSVDDRVAASSWWSVPAPGLGEGTNMHVARTGRFSANDVLTWVVWDSVGPYSLTAVYFGLARTRMRVKYSPT